MTDSTPSNMANFTENSYNLTVSPQSWCVAKDSIYTNPTANFNYFNSKCGDPYTYYSYWYRRYPSQVNYLNCGNIPYRDPLLHNKWGYIRPGRNCYNSGVNYHVNQRIGGFRFYDTQINPVGKRVSLRA
jgi:hypothetical protein